MNRILGFLAILMTFQLSVQAQDAALRERVNRLGVYVEELLEDKARQQKQIADLTREVESLRDQLQQNSGTAQQEDVSSLAQTVRELARKQEADKESILKAIEELDRSAPSVSTSRSGNTSGSGYYYTVAKGDTLSAIVKAYNDAGVKVTVNNVIQANPGLKPSALQIGQEIFIPEQ